MEVILIVSLMVQCVCALVNMWHKVSRHSAGTGLIIGALLAYSHIFFLQPNMVALYFHSAFGSSHE